MKNYFDMKKITVNIWSNSGKTKTVKTYIERGLHSLVLSEEKGVPDDRGINFKNKYIDEELPLTNDDIERMNEYIRNKDLQILKMENDRKEEAKRLEMFLDSELLPGIKYVSFYDKMISILENNGDYTQYSYIELSIIALSLVGEVEIEWCSLNDGYNRYPKLVNDILTKEHGRLNPDLYSEDGRAIKFYILRDLKVEFEITCKDELIGIFHFETNYRNFNFKIERNN